jgi:hypothetical protein
VAVAAAVAVAADAAVAVAMRQLLGARRGDRLVDLGGFEGFFEVFEGFFEVLRS